MRYVIDMREQVVSFPPQPVITEDNLVVSIDTVIYFQVTDPVAATYEIANYISGRRAAHHDHAAQHRRWHGPRADADLAVRTSTAGCRGVLDEATGRWGIRVGRVEIKGIDPPPSIKDSMEKQMRADRDKRAVILTAEGQRQSSILTAEGNKQAAILYAEGDREALILRAQANREAAILRAQGEGQAIQTVFQAIHDGQPDQALLAYQYLQMMPKIAEGSPTRCGSCPREITKALEGLGSADARDRRHPEGGRRAAQAGRHRPELGPEHRAATRPCRAPTRRCRRRSRRRRRAGRPRAAPAQPAAARRRHADDSAGRRPR